jgi:5'-deoxynucleotidase YfbR-like HD superfamily hydrolase
VAMIARDICVEADMDDTNVVKYALDHDLDEIMTGDIPSPAKARLGVKSDYNGKSKSRCSQQELLIVKAADLIDAYLFIKHNHHDRHGKQVFRYMEDKLYSFMDAIDNTSPLLGDAIDNTIAMLEFGQFDVEQRNE